MFYIRARYVNLLVPFSSTAFCSTICHGFIVDMCVFYDQSLMFYILSAFSSCLYTFIIHSIVRNFSWSMPLARHPHMWRTLLHLTSLLDLPANIYNYHSSMCVAIILSDGVFNYQCPRVVFIVLLHSVIFHIVHVHTWSGVSCCQIYLTCWWFLAHWTWRHVFLTCYMLVAFGTSDMISCYWHVYHLWSGLDVLYRFRLFHCLHPLSPTAFSSKHISWSRFCHVNHTCWWTLVHLTWVQTFLVWFSVTLLHSFISHIVITQTCSSVLCCQHYHTCWWLLAHRRWHHVFSSFRFLVLLYTHS
jgi:hypothetical protein